MASSVWKGTLTFGLLAIPIKLYTAARSQRINLHQLHKVCHTRLKQPLFCPHCNRQVERSEVVKGYEYEKGQYVIVTDEELKKITPRSSTVMELVAFVKQDQIDPIYFDASYFMLPDKEAEKPYALLLKTLEDSNRVGIATVTMHQREYTVFIRPRKNGLTVHTMYYQNEIREVAGYGHAEKDVKLKPAEIKLAEQLVESLEADFKPQQFHDKFQDNLKALIEAKQKGREVIAEEKPKPARVIDMMEALKRSLAQSQKRSVAEPARDKKPAARRTGTENRRKAS
jgi:DNA end-binding protein Ku